MPRYSTISCCFICKSSSSFNTSNDVKQGGVLSPLLFGIYFDELLLRLKRCGSGCHIGNSFAGAFAYADDATLLAPTKRALRKMLDVSKEFATEYSLKFNALKSQFVVFSLKDTASNININFDNRNIKSSPYATHLGHLVGNFNRGADIKVESVIYMAESI